MDEEVFEGMVKEVVQKIELMMDNIIKDVDDRVSFWKEVIHRLDDSNYAVHISMALSELKKERDVVLKMYGGTKIGKPR